MIFTTVVCRLTDFKVYRRLLGHKKGYRKVDQNVKFNEPTFGLKNTA